MKSSTAILFALALFASSFCYAENEIVIKFSHVLAPDSAKGQAAEKFKELAEQRTNGRVKVKIYPNSLLYNKREEIEALQSGAVQMLAPAFSQFKAAGLNSFDLFDLPFVFPSLEIMHRFVDGKRGSRLFKKLPAKGLVGLAYWDNGYKQMSSNKAMHTVRNLRRLKIRTQPSKVLAAQVKALGASAQQLPVSEVYASLHQGMVDGAENTVADFYTENLHEVQQHLTISNHGYLGYAVIVNKSFWDSLPIDIRTTLTQAMKETTTFERDIAQQINDNALTKVIAANTTNVYTLSPRQRTAWQRALLPVYQEFDRSIGNYLIRSVGYTAKQVKREQDRAKKKQKAERKK